MRGSNHFSWEDYVNYVNMLKILKEEFVKHLALGKSGCCFFDVLKVEHKLMMEKRPPSHVG